MSQSRKRNSPTSLNLNDVELSLEILRLNKPMAYQNILNEIEQEMLKISRQNIAKEAKTLSQKYGPIKRLKLSAKGRKKKCKSKKWTKKEIKIIKKRKKKKI